MKDNIKKIFNDEDKKSNSSVLNLSLESTKERNKESISFDDISDIKNELMNEVNLPIENEIIESQEFILEGKEGEIFLENGFLLENNDENINILEEKQGIIKRNKTFVAKKFSIKKPKHILKDPVEYITPLKLCRKTFGNIPKWNKKPNKVLCDLQKDIIESKSCNDDDSQDDFFLTYSKTERATPNHEDLQDLLKCRKKMILFKNCINDRPIKEYENILNIDNVFVDKKNINNHNSKKFNFWHKHIKNILKDSNNSCMTRISAGYIINKEKKNEDGLFILGILESAFNERRGRYTTNI